MSTGITVGTGLVGYFKCRSGTDTGNGLVVRVDLLVG